MGNESKIIAYGVVVAETPAILSDKVNEHMKKGWQPIGGICCDHRKNSNWLYQAIVLISSTDSAIGE